MSTSPEKENHSQLFQHELVSVLAHQLRTSLAANKWILKMFQDGDVGELTGEQRAFIDKASIANERMIALVSEMLSLSKIQDIEYNMVLKDGDIVELIDDALFDFTSESYKRGVEVIFLRPKEEIPRFPFEFSKMRFVIQSIVENAIKYSDKGDRVVISIARLSPTEIEVSVKDTGIGISEQEQPRIFEKYFRAENAHKKEEVGTGLGLYSAKQIVEQHGGTMRFESTEGVGSTFFFTLPTVKKTGLASKEFSMV